jgi:hypothetical protein
MKFNRALLLVALTACLPVSAQLVTYDFETGVSGQPANASLVDGDLSAGTFSINDGRSITYPSGDTG